MTVLTHRADIWLSRSTDLHSWAPPEPVLAARPGGWWDSARIGIGPPPIETPEGWLLIYHGVRQTASGALYRAGLALLDLEEPATSGAAVPNGSWVRGRTTNSWEMYPELCFPAG